ncbi:hypothetical protein GY14_30475 [Delftia tsuruhatensis]|jgi:hypothetical protein|nr:hypothetical protein GY14_30475 [Delftia tsuruhatensis]
MEPRGQMHQMGQTDFFTRPGPLQQLRQLLCCSLLGLAPLAQAAQLQVGAGSRVDFGDATVRLGCADLHVNGSAAASASTLNGIATLNIGATGGLQSGTAQVALSGDFVRSGSFDAGGSTVSIMDSCAHSISRVSGGTVFNHLSVTSGTGKTLELAAGQSTTVLGQLTLQGAQGRLLRLRSSAAGTAAQLSATAQQSVQFVDVADNRATGEVLAFGKPDQFQSQASGNLFRWFQFDAQGQDQGGGSGGSGGSDIRRVPSLSIAWTATLGALLALAGMARMAALRRKPQRSPLRRF